MVQRTKSVIEGKNQPIIARTAHSNNEITEQF